LLAWGRFGSISAPFGEPSRFTLNERSGKMEEGKIATACHSLVRLKESINVYKNACATLRICCVGQVRINFSSGDQPVVLLVQLNVRKMEEGNSNGSPQFGATEEIHQYIRMRVLP
jgi:hypothetical protein